MSRKSKATRQETTVLNPIEDTKHKYSIEEIIEIQDKYNGITLNFGKYKGKTLVEMFESKDTQDYLLWLKKEFLKTPKDERTPTKNAIIKWITAVLDNRV
jgi:uncharacterized protein (DUF3820 family)